MAGLSIKEHSTRCGEIAAVRERALLTPLIAPMMMESSPHVVRPAWLSEHLGWSPRRRMLIELFAARVAAMQAHGVFPICALIGGSFVADSESPNDLDALVIYRTSAEPEAIAAALRPKTEGLDLRYVPQDADPILLIKMICFFHALYQGLEKGACRGSLLTLFPDPISPGEE